MIHVGRCLGRGAVAATLVLAVACHDDTAPRPPAAAFDAARARAQIEPIAVVFDQSIFKSFNGALSFYENFFRSGVVLAPDVGAGPRSLAGRTAILAARIAATRVPATAMGTTYVYDPETKTYVPDPDATGAPAAGVRFVLYAWSDVSVGPALPLTRIGYVDIAAVSLEGVSPRLTQVVVVRDAPMTRAADFVTVHGSVDGVESFGISGTATDGTTTVSVALDGTYTGAPGNHQLTFNSTLSSGPGIGVHETLTYDQVTVAQGGTLELTYDGHTLSDRGTPSRNDVTFDGGLYATVLPSNEPGGALAYLRPDGSPLPLEEILDLTGLLQRAEVADFFWINLAWP